MSYWHNSIRKTRIYWIYLWLPLWLAASRRPGEMPRGEAALPVRAAEPVTFSKDVAPILQRSCVSCHRPGEMAPMSLMTYEDARPWARAIKARTASHEMPPFHIDKSIGITSFKNDPSLINGAVEEFFRTQPILSSGRRAKVDFEWHGQQIKAGDIMVMFYPSANRDAAAFDNPDSFDIERSPNRHLAFGTGPHLCLGMHLARMEIRALFAELLPRLADRSDRFTVVRSHVTFSGGHPDAGTWGLTGFDEKPITFRGLASSISKYPIRPTP